MTQRSPDLFQKPKLTISKLDAAKRQLETAIVLYFHEADPVAIHTLSAAAHAILDDLSRTRGAPPTLKQSMSEMVKPDYRKEFRERLDEARNFFKHADRDPDASLHFKPYQTELFMFDAATTYFRLAGERPAVLTTYVLWSAATWGNAFISYPDADPNVVARLEEQAASMGRSRFFDHHLPIAHTASTLGKSGI
jgi:hypothetical protein